jgi:acyl-coenzyme A thioesterase PaaI-like protein
MSPEERIRRRVLRALALNRTPGYHFPGNFIDLSFDRVASDATQVSYESGEHDIGALGVAADFALGTAIRADLDPSTRLATVSMTLELAREARPGIIRAASRCHGFLGEGDGRIGRGRVVLEDGGGEFGYGSGAFMVLQPPPGMELHPVPHRMRGDAEPPMLAEGDLAPDELDILRRADEALERAARTGQPFIRHFWGFLPQAQPGGASCVMPNGPHVGNRVGYVQGGILLGLAAATAGAALPQTWMLSAIAAAFVSPGQGPALKAQARVVHQGQRSGVIRTEITRNDGRRVLEVLSTHVQRQT